MTNSPARTDSYPHELSNDKSFYHGQSRHPIRELLAGAGIFIVFFVVTMTAFAMLSEGLTGSADAVFEDGDMNDPLGASFTLASVIIALPITILAVRWGGRRPAGTLFSVNGHFRWEIVKRSIAPTLLVSGISILCVLFVTDFHTPVLDKRVFILIALFFLLTPFQAIAEEVLFRAFLPQILGAWMKNPWLVNAPAVILFTAGHLYNWVGLIDIFIFAVCTAYLTHRTGGIEAAATVHSVNNLFFFICGAVALIDANMVDIPWEITTISCVSTIVLTAYLHKVLPS